MATPKATEVKAGKGSEKETSPYPKGLGGEASLVDAPLNIPSKSEVGGTDYEHGR